MDIGSNDNYPGCALSNFAGHRFIIDGIPNRSCSILKNLKNKDYERS